MADITKELSMIESERYGFEIRKPIHDALDKVNTELEEKKKGSDQNG